MMSDLANADLKRILAFENKPSLILAFVNVQRNAGGRLVCGFDQGVASSGLLADSQKCEPTATHMNFSPVN